MGLPVIALAATVAGTAVSALGQISSAHAASQNAAYQAQVAQNNATIAAQNAAYASKAGAANIERQQLKQRAENADLAVAMAANGIDINTGSAADVRRSRAELGQLDTENTAQQAALNVYGYRTQGVNYQAEAGLRSAESSQATTAGMIGAGGTLLSGAGGLASKWLSWQNANGGGLNGDSNLLTPGT